MIRLPYLVVLAHWVAQRGRFYRGQITGLLAELESIAGRDRGDLLSHLADDASRELLNQLRDRSSEDVSHFALQCARSLDAARSAMTTGQFGRHLADAHRLINAVSTAVPWHGRLRATVMRPGDRDPRHTLQHALIEAARWLDGADSGADSGAVPGVNA